jgi:hypothetical protein
VTAPTFEPKGAMTVRAACIEVIRRIAPKGGISYSQALDDVRDLTGLDDLDRLDIMGPMNQASKHLRTLGEPGVTNRARIGWERETEDGMVRAGERHERKAQRQVRWAVSAVAHIEVDKLSWEARSRREGVIDRNRRISELETRRAARKRPLPPAESA